MRLLPSPHLTYFAMQAFIIGGAVGYMVVAHLPVLWSRRRPLLLATLLIVIYGCALDAWAIHSGWGWFDPRLVSGVWLGDLLLEELSFWTGTAFVTVAAALVMAEATERHIPWWVLPATLVLPSWLWLANLPRRDPASSAG